MVFALIKRKTWIRIEFFHRDHFLFCQRMPGPEIDIGVAGKQFNKFQSVFSDDLIHDFLIEIIQI